ncbi:MAG: ABC transporter ATP-binding protein [Thermicanus sp.]|nr:ABC transporter ATP-binding protein [Thermicanus sp.]
MIEVSRLKKEMNQLPVLEEVSFSLERGTITGLIGRNGTGKTTLLRLMMGILLPDQGDVRYEGESIYAHPEKKNHLVFLPENKLMLQNYSVNQIVRLYKMFYPHFDESYLWRKIAQFNLPVNRRIRQFSKGMKALFSLILAFATRADVILLDEPTDGLDAVVKRQWYELLVDEVAEQQHTVLISSHRLDELESVCDSVMILKNGRIETNSDLNTLKTNYYKLQIVYDKAIPTEMLHLPGTRVLAQAGRIVTLMVEENRKEEAMTQIKASQPLLIDELPVSLEELFVATVGGEDRGEKDVK